MPTASFPRRSVPMALTDFEKEQGRSTVRAHTGRVHPRPLAAVEQLGALGEGVRGGGLRAAHAGLARRPQHGRRGQDPSRGVRRQVDQAGRRPLRRGHPGTGEAAGRARPLLRRPPDPDPRGPRPLCASVAIDPAPFRGVLPLPFSAPWTEAEVDSLTPRRGPMLIISGEKDHTVPPGDRQRVLQAPEAQRGRHRDRRDEGPRPLPHDRPRLARGGRHRPRLHQAVRQLDAGNGVSIPF